jgi:3-deoxy-D-manno-octulosonate 8-phosphate phosphatase (KDO 8-P phosphatase)
MCGFSAAPADAATEVRAEAEFVADLPGGRGAVRQAIEALLRADGRWEQILARLAGPAKTGGPA